MNIRIDIHNEITWPQFKQLREVKNLSERDKIRHYNFYLEQLNTARFQYWHSYQPRGNRYLQQEDLNYILQEDGSYIIIT